MKALDELRQHGGSFPGGLWNVLVEIDQRLTALEGHAPMLDALKPEWDAHQAAEAARAAQDAEIPGPGVEVHIPHHLGEAPHLGTPEAAPGAIEAEAAKPAVQSLESQQAPAEGAQGGQS